jgi:hypothetical protein
VAGGVQLSDLLFEGVSLRTVRDACQLFLATGLLGGYLIFKGMGL